MVRRGRWQQQRWHYQTIHRKQTSPVPVQMAAQAFWAIFGHFRRSPSSVRRTAAPSTPPQRIPAQSIFLQSTLAPLQLCLPSLERGHNCSSHHFWQAAFLPSLSTSLDAYSTCLQAPLPEAVKSHAVEAWFTKHPGVKVNWL